jgi:His-Xaa-Ser system protein HxsD
MVREIVVEFDAGVHSLDALRAAAYRLMGVASCQIENNGQKFICQITPNPSRSTRQAPDADSIRLHFIDLVTDETLREQLAKRTEPMRNLILSLAFGSLVSKSG